MAHVLRHVQLGPAHTCICNALTTFHTRYSTTPSCIFMYGNDSEPIYIRHCDHHTNNVVQTTRCQYQQNGCSLSKTLIGPILRGHSGPLCHALSLLLSLWTSILHCNSPGVSTVARRLRWLQLILVVVSTVATPGEWQYKISTGGVRRLAVANGPNFFQMLLVT